MKIKTVSVVFSFCVWFLKSGADVVLYTSLFSSPQAEHIRYSVSAYNEGDRITLSLRGDGGDTVIGRAEYPNGLSGTYRVDLSEGPVQVVLQRANGTNVIVDINTINPSSEIKGVAYYDESITPSATITSPGFGVTNGVTVTLNDDGSIVWTNSTGYASDGTSFYGDGNIVVKGAVFPGLGVNCRSFKMSDCQSGFTGIQGESVEITGCLVSTGNGRANIHGKSVKVTDCLFNGRWPAIYWNLEPSSDNSVSADETLEMRGSEVCGGIEISSGQCVFAENTFYRIVECQSGQISFSHNTFLRRLNISTDASVSWDNNYFCAPASDRDVTDGWLNPWFLEKEVPCLNDGAIERCSRTEPRNVDLFRFVDTSAGQSVMLKQRDNPTNSYYSVPNFKNFGEIRAGLPFAVSFDLRSCAEELSGVTYRLKYNGKDYQPEGSFTARARRKVSLGTDNQNETLNFILPAPAGVGTNNEWELVADFSECSANIEKPSPSLIQVATGQIDVQSPGFARPLRIGVLEVTLDDGSKITNCSASARSHAIKTIYDNFRSRLSLTDSEIEVIDLGVWSFTGTFSTSWLFGTVRANQIATELEWFISDYNSVTAGDPLDFIVGVTPVNALGGTDGVSLALRRHVILVDESTPRAALHEFGHAAGLYTGLIGTLSEQYFTFSNSYTDQGYLSAGRGLDLGNMSGFNAGIADPVIGPSKIHHFPACIRNMVYDVMGSKEPQWISPDTFNTMQAWLKYKLGIAGVTTVSEPVTAAAAVKSLVPVVESVALSNRLVHVGAVLSRLPEGDQILTSSIRLEEIVDGRMSGGGATSNLTYRFSSYDALGNFLSETQCVTEVSGYVTNTFWQQTFLVPAQAVRYELTRAPYLNQTPAWSYSSGFSLTNSLQADYDAETDVYALNWSNSGTIRTVENRLMVSLDNGSTWTPRPLPTYTNRIVVSRTGTAFGSPLFKLLSSDGIQSVFSDVVSGRPSIASPSVIHITSPLPNAQSTTGVVWQLAADVVDVNDDLASVQWFSSIDGLLGSSSSISVELSPGNHLLSVIATDASGLATTGSVDVMVGTLTSVDLMLYADDLVVSPVINGYRQNAVGYGQTNNFDMAFRNQGASNTVQVQVYLTPPGGSESILYDDLWKMSPFDVRNLSLEFDAPVRGDYQLRAVYTPLEIPDSDTNNNQIIVVYTNQPPQMFPGRISVLSGDLPLSVPLAAEDPNGDPVVFSMSPAIGASIQGSTLIFDNGGMAGSYTFQVAASDGDLMSDSAVITMDVYEGGSPAAPVITSGSSCTVTSNVPFLITITVDNGPCTFSSTNLPFGMFLDENTGEIRGMISSGGIYEFSVTAQNGAGSDSAWISLEAIESGSAVNDNFADATPLTGSSLNISASTFGATLEPGEPAHTEHGVSATASVWWRWTAPSNGVVGIQWSGSFAIVCVYTGSSFSTLTEQGSASGFSSLASFNAAAGEDYFISMSTVMAGALTLNLGYYHEPVLRAPLQITLTQNSPVDITFETWNTASGFSATDLPAGMALDGSTGRLSGVPTEYGSFSPQITVTNAYGSSTASVIMEIRSTNAPSILGPFYAAATLGESFSCYVQSQNASPGTFGALYLPVGLNCDAESGVISGTPQESGIFSVSLSAGNVDTAEYTDEEMTLLVRMSYALWLDDHGFTEQQQADPSVSDADADPDDDGATNYEEFIAGTDPLNAADVLKAELIMRNREVLVSWPGKVNRRYIIQRTGSLVGGFSSVTNNVIAVIPSNTVHLAPEGAASFYRIQVQE